MALSSGTSSGSTTILPNSGSEGDLHQHVVDQRKQKRMLSNRESARRSRMRKQKHLDDLMVQVAQLKKENNQILTTYKVTTQQYLAVEAENSVLRTQMMELNTRLQSLDEILNYMDGNNNGYVFDSPQANKIMDTFMTPLGMFQMDGNNNGYMFDAHQGSKAMDSIMNQPILASADIFLY